MASITIIPWNSRRRGDINPTTPWIEIGVAPWFKDVGDGKSAQAVIPGGDPNTDSVDGYDWRDAGGVLPNWLANTITAIDAQVNLNVIQATPFLNTIVARLDNLGGSAFVINPLAGYNPAVGANWNSLAGNTVCSAPGVFNNWADYMRAYLEANQMFIAAIASNQNGLTGMNFHLDAMRLLITYNAVPPPPVQGRHPIFDF